MNRALFPLSPVPQLRDRKVNAGPANRRQNRNSTWPLKRRHDASLEKPICIPKPEVFWGLSTPAYFLNRLAKHGKASLSKGPHGICTSFGPVDWIDQAVVTDARGDFEIACSKPAWMKTSPPSGNSREPDGMRLRTMIDAAEAFDRACRPC